VADNIEKVAENRGGFGHLRSIGEIWNDKDSLPLVLALLAVSSLANAQESMKKGDKPGQIWKNS